MKLSELISPQVISVDERVPDKTALIRALVRRVITCHCPGTDAEEIERRVFEHITARERRGATILDYGIACPHVAVPGFPGVGVALTVLKEAVDFDPPNARPVRAVFLVVSSKKRASVMLKIMAEIARLASDEAARTVLLGEVSAAGLCRFLQRQFDNVGVDLQARDVMRPPHVFITPDQPLRRVVEEMLRFDVDAMGIVDHDHRLVGEVTSDRLFQLGMPDFFTQLKSVAFIGDFDPFERYFEQEPVRSAGDVMLRDFAVAEETTPILEVIFKLAVQRYAKVYVLRDGVMVGIIDRIRVLEKILSI